MESKPKYSFVMPAYKAAFIKEAIDSILGQTYSDFELIIVNDASPEDIDGIVSEYDDSRIRLYKNNENIGGRNLVGQWNHSITYALGDLIILASDDDVYDKDFLENINKLACRYPDIHVFKSLIRQIDNAGNIISTENALFPEICVYKDYFKAFCQGKMPSGIPQFAFRKDELIKRGGFVNFPSAWFSDDATVARLATNGIAVYNHVCFSSRVSGINISSKNNSFRLMKAKIKASVDFNFFILNEFDADFIADIKNILVEKVRRVTYKELLRTSNVSFFRSMAYMLRLNTSVYPLSWVFRYSASRLYHQIIK